MSNVARINGPGEVAVGSDQYQQDCMFALEPSVNKLIELAAETGWDQQQAVYAVMCIAALQVNDRRSFSSDLIGPVLLDDADSPFPGKFRSRDITSPAFSLSPTKDEDSQDP